MKKLIPFVMLLVLTACEQTCNQLTSTACKLEFTSAENTTIPTIPNTLLTVYGIWEDGERVDTAFIYKQGNHSQISLPLRTNSNESQFEFIFESGDIVHTDIVTITYQNYPNFISVECGCNTIQDLLNVQTTNNYIESITIVNPSITSEGYLNGKIYLK